MAESEKLPSMAKETRPSDQPELEVRDLRMCYGKVLIQEGVSFTVRAGTIFAVMGVSGSGKSTLLKHIVGLVQPAGGQVLLGGADYWAADDATQSRLRGRCGMLFQSSALWSSMTVRENICLPLKILTDFDSSKRNARVLEVLTWVEMEKYGDYYPADLSGGMQKRAGLARALAAEPPLLILDEPSAGLDPIGSRRFDDLIVSIRDRTHAAVVFVSHELPSLLSIADDGIFFDVERKTPSAHGKPRDLLDQCTDATVHAFLHREDPGALAGADELPGRTT